MVRIVIIGGGFAGLAAARALGRASGLLVTLIDYRLEQQFLPLLPDVVGRRFDPSTLRYPLLHAAERWGCQIVNAVAHDIDLQKRRVACAGASVPFDYLIVASGAQTTFFGRNEWRQHALTLDSIEDATRIPRSVCHHSVDHVVVCGAGYTGIEIATHVRRRLDQEGEEAHITLVDKAPTPVPQLEEAFQRYVTEQLDALGIALHTETTVAEAGEAHVVLGDGTRFEDSVLIWTAGVEATDVVQKLSVEKDRQQRISVKPDLSFADRCFAAGDAAGFPHKGSVLRPSVQFALSQGRHAARNIRRLIEGQNTVPFTPRDPGYVVPFGHGKGCGRVLGVPLTGRLPCVLHYLICGLRSWGVANRLNVWRDLWRSTRGR